MIKRWLLAYSNMWKCSCGAWNPDSADKCLSCGGTN